MSAVSPAPVRAADSVRVPGGIDIWVFVLGDMVIFSAYFAAYLFLDRAPNRALFVQSQSQLSQALGLFNTLLLLTSSLFVAMNVQAAKLGDKAAASKFVALGGVYGGAFLVVKSCEWYAKISSGFTITTDPFFMHYYMLTSLHVVHVLLGLLFLAIVRREFRGARVPRLTLVEAGGIYWHMVDFLWILIFAFVYLMR
jgi:nitric oxide reductase NorE protein